MIEGGGLVIDGGKGVVAVEVIATPVGDARAHVAMAAHPVGCLVLGHGAGGGVEAADLVALARTLPALGITVVRVEQPWRVAGRRVATPAATLDRAWLAVLDALADVTTGVPLVVGGRSSGARVACRTAAAVGAAGVLALAFPLRPPWRPDTSRLPELDLPAAAGLPVLVLQGSGDTFGGPAEFPAAPGRLVVAVEGGDHSFRVASPHDQAGTLDNLVTTAREWVLAVCRESSPDAQG